MTTLENPDDDAIRSLLEGTRRIVVVGLSPKPHRTSHHIALYLQEQGYEVVPVYPREEKILGQAVYRRVQDVPGTVDLVNVFRRSEAVPGHRDELLAMTPPPRVVWMQSGVAHDETAAALSAAGAKGDLAAAIDTIVVTHPHQDHIGVLRGMR